MIGLTLAVGAVVVLAIIIFAWTGLQRGEAELQTEADTSIANLAQILDRPLWDFDTERTNIIASIYARDPDIERLLIRESSGKVLFSIDRARTPDAVQKSHSILHDGRQLGEVQLALSRESYKRQIWEFVRAAAIVGVVALLAAFATTALLVRTLLHKPLARLTDAVNAYAKGDYSQAPASSTYLEFQRFETVLIEMGQRIKTQLAELQNLNANLEARTLALSRANERLTEEEHALLTYQQQLQSLSSRLLIVEERERRNFSQLLHDHIGQSLTYAKLRLGVLRTQLSDPEVLEPIQEVLTLLEQMSQETRSLTYELSPPLLYEIGLDAALEWLCEHFESRYQLRCTFESNEVPELLDIDARIVLFQAVRELLFNVVKHAKASAVTISVVRSEGRVKLSVKDDGVGLKEEKPALPGSAGFGLFSVRERLQHIGGTLHVDTSRSEEKHGTCVTLIMPIKQILTPT
jgi:signal transduction histidine kinase